MAPSLLRFITCGSVDDGKSTLIGRLLFEADTVAEDQLAALQDGSKRYGTQGAEVDYALLMDGLSAEREQGITIDVGFRYFSTPRRRFIVADTPGHEQYTRNMATGASTASLAVVLVDARKGLLEQTRRHSLIVAMLGVRHLVLAVNKMDLIGFDPQLFGAIERDYRRFAEGLGDCAITCIPICARGGDNVVGRSAAMPWYGGPTLLEHLETVDGDAALSGLPFRMPVQWVSRPDPEFRGYAGRVASGSIRRGEAVRILPSGGSSRVERIVTMDGDLEAARADQSVTLTLADAIDVSRGDTIVGAGPDRAMTIAAEFTARLLWVGADPAVAGRSYLLKIGTSTVPARLEPVLATLDINTGALIPAGKQAALPGLNGIALVPVRLDQPFAFDAYAANRETGGFILIDRASNTTVAMGLVESAGIDPGPGGLRPWLDRVRERPWRSLAKAVSWRVTGSVDTVLLTLIVTGDARVSLAVGGFEVFTKLILYYVHERVWARVPLGLGGGKRR
ncbi:MAG: hypothetical protein NVS2B11_07470 [Acetobacteraceae bacterium]